MSNYKPTEYEFGIVTVTKTYSIRIVDDFNFDTNDMTLRDLEQIVLKNIEQNENIFDELGLEPYETEYWVDIDDRTDITEKSKDLLRIDFQNGETLEKYVQ